MRYHRIKDTSIKIAQLVFGTSCFGNLYQALDFDTKLAIAREWFRHVEPPVIIDSAGKYGAGLALECVGKCLRKLEISPDDIIVSNKLGWKRVPLSTPEPSFEPGAWVGIKHDAVQDISYRGILECYEQGCELIGGDYAPQMVSVHDPDEYLAAADGMEDRIARFEDIIEAYQALHELKAGGRVKAVGIGSKDWRVIKEISKLVDLDWVMFACSLTPYRHEAELLEFISELNSDGVSMINSAVFNSGFLVGGEFFDYRRPDPVQDAELFSWRNRFLSICKNFDVSPAAACIQYGMRIPGISATALNTSKPGNIERNIKCFEEIIPEEFWNRLEAEKII
jgi:D-threo-aldose 1-dehydrogenase